MTGVQRWAHPSLNTPILKRSIRSVTAKKALKDDWENAISEGKERDCLKQELLKNSNEEILEIDTKAYKREWYDIQTKWFIPKFFAERTFMKKLRYYKSNVISNEVSSLLDMISSFQKCKSVVDNYTADFVESFGLYGKSQIGRAHV